MAFQQVARLYLRGALCNKILKTLQPHEREELEEIIETVMNDPNLQQCRREFCNALARTIKNEYMDKDVGEQDLRIAIMRAAVAARFGDKPAISALTDPIQRKKWFQTWVFNYLRQILRENKIACNKRYKRIKVRADAAAVVRVCEILEDLLNSQSDISYKRSLRQSYKRLEIKETNIGYTLKFDHWAYPIELTSLIAELNNNFKQHNISISYEVDGIIVNGESNDQPLLEITQHTNEFIKTVSFDTPTQNEDETLRDNLEMEATQMRNNTTMTMEQDDVIAKLSESIPYEAKPILSILMEETRPKDYVERFGESQPRIVHIAEYLDISSKEVKRLKEVIKMHCLALGVGR
jgi:hypothetical protein